MAVVPAAYRLWQSMVIKVQHLLCPITALNVDSNHLTAAVVLAMRL
jgi:hypothetical protein